MVVIGIIIGTDSSWWYGSLVLAILDNDNDDSYGYNESYYD